MLPQTGSKEWGHGQVLITTQDSGTIPQNAPHTYHESLSKGMRRDEAVELLETVSQISEPVQAENVAELLDFQPLALAAAAYYVQTVVTGGSSNYNWKAYLQDISTYSQRKTTETVLANESSAYAKTTMAAVEMAIQRAVETDEVLRHTFSFLSVCANDDLPLETVLKFVKAQLKDQLPVLIKAKIVKSSLILVHSEEGGERTYLRLHKVVHEALKRGEIPYLKSFESDHTMAKAVKILKVELDENYKNYAFCEKLRPHCESLLKRMTSEFSLDQTTFSERFAPFLDLNTIIDWLHILAWVCQKSSYFYFAKIVANLAHNLLGNLDATSTGAVILQWKVLNVSGVIYTNLKEYNQAKELHKKALIIRKKIFGEDHAAVATSYNNLHQCMNAWENTIKPKNFTKKH